MLTGLPSTRSCRLQQLAAGQAVATAVPALTVRRRRVRAGSIPTNLVILQVSQISYSHTHRWFLPAAAAILHRLSCVCRPL